VRPKSWARPQDIQRSITNGTVYFVSELKNKSA
jgi:hypothetical protein